MAITLPQEAAIEDLPLYLFAYTLRSGKVDKYVIAVDRGEYFEEIKAPNARTLGNNLNKRIGEPDGGPLEIFLDAPKAFWAEKRSTPIIQVPPMKRKEFAGAFAKGVRIKWKRV